jgi:hypothetical protein
MEFNFASNVLWLHVHRSFDFDFLKKYLWNLSDKFSCRHTVVEFTIEADFSQLRDDAVTGYCLGQVL